MNKGMIFLTVFFIMILATVLVLYFFYQKPYVESININYYNLSIKASEELENGRIKQISTNIIVVLDNTNILYEKIKTEEDGYVLIKIPCNHTFSLFNENINNQTYYTTSLGLASLGDYICNNINMNFNLKKSGNLFIKQVGGLNESNITFISLTSINGSVRFINFCYRWSPNIISVVSSDTFFVSDPPKRLKGKVDRCYKTYFSLLSSNQTLIIPLYYKIWDKDMKSEIDLYILDGDIRYWSATYKNNGMESYLIEDIEGKDIGIEDIMFKIM